jgi:hypothetical protein
LQTPATKCSVVGPDSFEQDRADVHPRADSFITFVDGHAAERSPAMPFGFDDVACDRGLETHGGFANRHADSVGSGPFP